MVSKLCVLLPKETTKFKREDSNNVQAFAPARKCWELEESFDRCNVPPSQDTPESCMPTGQCWEKASPFTGGSAPWKGTLRQQEAAAKAAKAAAEDAEPPCVWARCPWHSCTLFSCSGSYNLRSNRPRCAEITKPPDKAAKQMWCYPFETSMLQRCKPCPPGRYDCPVQEREETCRGKPRKLVPLFRWKDGIPYPNYRMEPYPHLLEGLDWKQAPPPKPPPPRKTDLWSLGCWRFYGEEPTFDPCARTPPCPGRFVKDTPSFTWHSGYCKENYAQLPYPGHGPDVDDACQMRLRELRRRKFGPEPRRYTEEEVEARCRATGGSSKAWCACPSHAP